MGTLTVQALAEDRPDIFGSNIVAVMLLAGPGEGRFVTGGTSLRLRRSIPVMAHVADMACRPYR